LLAQGATEAGYQIDEAGLQARLDELTGRMGGPQALAEWMAAYGYTEATFRSDLARSLAAAWMRDEIGGGVPETAEQVHVRQILFRDAESANAAYSQIQTGADFTTLAAENDPLAHGDLGWFPQGYLPDPLVEQAAFALQPGETSAVIESPSGYHILQVVERDPQRPLDPDARLSLQVQAVQSWLEARRAESEIQILAP
jgi:parvulin-like peptidyl-prolyl isomerase